MKHLLMHRFTVLGAGMVLFGFFFLLVSTLMPLVGKSQTLRLNSGNLNVPNTLYFYDWGYAQTMPRGYRQFSYSMLVQVVESDRLILLYQNKMQATVIDKIGFTRGTPEGLIAFLCGNGQLSYQRVK